MEEPLLPSPLCGKELEDVIVQLHPQFISKFIAKQLNQTRAPEFDNGTTDDVPTVEAAIVANNGSTESTKKLLSLEEDFDATVHFNVFQWSLKSPETGVTYLRSCR
jgi:hypothetical protein